MMMRMRWLLVVTLLGGGSCGFQAAGLATDASQGGSGSGHDARVDGTADARADAVDADLDTDGDGILDAVDNCPMIANHDQRNWDHDAFGDACDLCPHINTAENTDGDGDGVGDACDPHPNTAGDSRALWLGFYDADDLADLTAFGGTWGISGGKLVQSATSAPFAILTYNTTVARADVQTAITVTGLMPGSGMDDFAGAGVAAGDAGTTQGYSCSVYSTGSTGGANSAKQAVEDLWSGGTGSDSDNFAPAFLNTDFRLTESLAAGSNTCTSVVPAETLTSKAAIGPAGGSVSLATYNATAKFDYLFVVNEGS
jgi:hypothetical protein